MAMVTTALAIAAAPIGVVVLGRVTVGLFLKT
jgi:hypothetical protein